MLGDTYEVFIENIGFYHSILIASFKFEKNQELLYHIDQYRRHYRLQKFGKWVLVDLHDSPELLLVLKVDPQEETGHCKT